MNDETENEPPPKRQRNQVNYGELEDHDISRNSETDDEDFELPSQKLVMHSKLV